MSDEKTSGHGIRRYTGHGMGMDNRYVLHPMCRHEHGRAVFVHAHQRVGDPEQQILKIGDMSIADPNLLVGDFTTLRLY